MTKYSSKQHRKIVNLFRFCKRLESSNQITEELLSEFEKDLIEANPLLEK